jgi:hypothetical protein
LSRAATYSPKLSKGIRFSYLLGYIRLVFYAPK